MLTDFTIRHFRGIKECSLEDLKRFNIFVGYNNCGKSSVLEAIYIYTSGLQPTSSFAVNRMRHYFKINEDAVKLNFFNLDTSVPIVFQESEIHKMSISYWEKLLSDVDFSTKSKDINVEKEYGLLTSLQIKNRKTEVRISFRDDEKGKGRMTGVATASGFPPVGYVNPIAFYDDVARFYATVLEHKEEQFIVEALQEIEPTIRDLVLIDNVIMADVGLSRRIPIQVLGDGIKKILSILLFIYQEKNGVLMIDEVDNGLHYKSMPTLWKTILHCADKFKVQLFITTHNIDSLQALKCVLEKDNYSSLQKDIRVYTLRKTKDNVLHALKNTYGQFGYLINQDLEIR